MCANSLSLGLKKIPGVTNVVVSLNRGTAELLFAAGNVATLEDVRQVVRKNGFRPTDATIKATGELQRKQSERLLKVSQRKTYNLRAAPEAQSKWDEFTRLPAGEHVMVSGRVSEKPKEPIVEVLDFSPRLSAGKS